MEQTASEFGDLKIDPATGVPYAYVFQFPISGFDTSDFGFGYGSRNDRFCMETVSGQCTAYGYHLGRDTLVSKTPAGTVVVSPADGIVRLSTDMAYGGYGSDTKANPAYKGCLLVLEHEFPNGQPVTTLLGHVSCEKNVAYDPDAKTGNPSVGTIVRRGQYVAHVAHYWAGATTEADWHHVHWAMRKGPFNASNVAAFVKGYTKKSEFTIDPDTGALTHPDWLDPFLVVAANGDPALLASANVRHHPSGSLLEDESGAYWLVLNGTDIAPVSAAVLASERYDPARAVRVADEEIGCFAKAPALAPHGPVVLYQRPNSSTVVMAYANLGLRYDVIRWEALLSWGFDAGDLTADPSQIQFYETQFLHAGFRLLRPGTLVKGDAESEVAIVTTEQKRLPIASADVFEALGFGWERVVTIPQEVLTQVAGPRENGIVVDAEFIHACAVPPPCPDPGTCGGGGPDEPDPSGPELCNGLDDDGDGQIDEVFLCAAGSLGGVCITSCNTAGQLLCTAPSCSWGACQPYPEVCDNTIDDDCDGATDCADAACTASSSCTEGTVELHVSYAGPASPGSIHLEAWWQPPNAPPRPWGTVPECADGASGDGLLDCTFAVPAGTSPFEFQVILPDGRFWGDLSCTPQGGCGNTVGTLTVTSGNGSVAVSLVPNNQNNQPYYNGWIANLP